MKRLAVWLIIGFVLGALCATQAEAAPKPPPPPSSGWSAASYADGALD